MSRTRVVTPGLAVAGQARLSSLPGVGPKVADRFAARGILSVQDLWLHLPLRYEDRTRLTTIAQLQGGVPAQIEGRVEAVERGFRFRPVLRVAVSDASHGTLVLRFFHFRAAQVAQFAVGTRVRVFGTPKPGQHGWEIVHPSYRVLAPDEDAGLGDSLDPVYPVLEGVGPATLRKLIGQALERLPPESALELLPPHWLQDERLPSLRAALLTMHRPPVGTDPQQLLAGGHPAQQRLAIEELLAHQLSLRRQRIALQRLHAPSLPGNGTLVQQLRKALPFQLTGAQQRVFEQIAHDLAQASPMLRLVQGDVGSGKTVVAALAAMLAVEQGKQVALAAPTELLAEQHLANLRSWLEPLGIRIVWLAGKVTGKARAAAMAEVASGQAQVVVGTHALMQEAVVFHDLALAIIDEQHRFGVHQRLALRDKGAAAGSVPHQLVMTATPIPRTLAMSAYADLDVSAIDQLPPGRTPVQTIVLSAERRPELVERIRAACAEGRQAYWVCTLIEESEEPGKGAQGQPGGPPRIEAQAAEVTFEALSAQLPGVRVALVHGRMKPAEKQKAMLDFKQGRSDLLVATTVIEVGVDVPNASLMIIENAERLGLAQLHQLRGRVGRGAAASSCVLLYQAPLSMMARQRLETMRQTNDGFVIAEKDLQLRGPGELLGTRQTGLASFRIADLARDAGLLPRVQVLAERLLAEAPDIADRVVERWIGGAVRYAAA
ncbi:ATP-dependent DNA helicase RecG [Xanthomonas citri pv. fuscans CFBP 6996]|uniref:ATP-dependent DNA helicase RecG n=1 Tax=Xanthomonas citri TaxID=346 RepID=UPI000C18FBC5|nr:ATP-dependent DNA helicase RecG [Xanthomonas citri]ATS40075.1 ATP-dependent DNA helicase RecG [Xanthomonas citri pv. phaseoli var. fuscans]ATS41115.1 ATP-dependent DNA helicase RecG [Xanthomonas citri pv. phaseoli var. fuscans]ATS52843.1 ATP-dependent DNA helicase RecG [Xanthomonas citri pv. phaseoli var. fuscans]ATS54721.1 ATP-dependent DNA helicase RecG [Xanthomonas citri pv. phaseoli var. fuscans]ATS61276.1 ATP-dependent DNA helicase RecG [Xanthomonas citri pv. phaseoli var. fuscans]